MALIICTECGKEFSNKAPACPNCGCPTEAMGMDTGSASTIDGIDVESIAASYANNKVEMAKYISHTYNKKLTEAKKIVDTYFAGQPKTSFLSGMVTEGRRINDAKQQAKDDEKARISQMKQENVVFCPKCHSTSVTYVDKKLSLGRAAVGGLLFNAPGAIVGGLTSKKGKVKCMSCGNTWKI